MHAEFLQEEPLCPTCNTGRLHPQIVAESFDYEVDGEKKVCIVAEGVPVRQCDNPACGERLSGPDAARIRHEAICRALRLLTPAEIQAIRERLGPTKESFAQLTGIGTATLLRWERGRLLQNRAMDCFLRLLARREENVRFLRQLRDTGENATTALAPIASETEVSRSKSAVSVIPRDTLGFGGELAVASELCRRGIAPHWMLGRCKRADLRVETDRRMLRVQVNTKQGKEWPSVRGIHGPDSVLVLVDYQDKGDLERPDFYVLLAADWDQVLTKELRETGKVERGEVTISLDNVPTWKDGSVGVGLRAGQVEPCKEAWEKVKELAAREGTGMDQSAVPSPAADVLTQN
jgi:putative zinc finger/helix-turn-helix YgiT family protein